MSRSIVLNGKYKTYDGKIGKLVAFADLNSSVEGWFDEGDETVCLIMLEFETGVYEYYLLNQLEEVAE